MERAAAPPQAEAGASPGPPQRPCAGRAVTGSCGPRPLRAALSGGWWKARWRFRRGGGAPPEPGVRGALPQFPALDKPPVALGDGAFGARGASAGALRTRGGRRHAGPPTLTLGPPALVPRNRAELATCPREPIRSDQPTAEHVLQVDRPRLAKEALITCPT